MTRPGDQADQGHREGQNGGEPSQGQHQAWYDPGLHWRREELEDIEEWEQEVEEERDEEERMVDECEDDWDDWGLDLHGGLGAGAMHAHRKADLNSDDDGCWGHRK